jgi:hypothetical protein
VEVGQYVSEDAFYKKVAMVSAIDEKEFKLASHWELVYPYKFFINLCKKALDVAAVLHYLKTSPFKDVQRKCLAS